MDWIHYNNNHKLSVTSKNKCLLLTYATSLWIQVDSPKNCQLSISAGQTD